jgi:outer membrane protein OmpA-like peptidoglycan-associated protein
MSKLHSNLGRGLGDLITEVSDVKAVPASASPAPTPKVTSPERTRIAVPVLAIMLAGVSLLAAFFGWHLWKLEHPAWRPKGTIEVSEAEPLTPMLMVEGGAIPMASAAALDFADSLRAPGLLVQRMGGWARVVFQRPLFSSGVVLEPEGARQLEDLARQLSAATHVVAIHVVGHTNNDPVRPNGPYRTSDDLSFARAVAAVNLFRAQGVALEMTAGVGPAPFPNTDPESKARNRTVTIEIRPR